MLAHAAVIALSAALSVGWNGSEALSGTSDSGNHWLQAGSFHRKSPSRHPRCAPARRSPRGPQALGRVFDENRSSIVHVRPRTARKDAFPKKGVLPRVGVVVGARGEILTSGGQDAGASGSYEVETRAGEIREASVLGFDRRLGLIVLRAERWDPNLAPPVRIAATDQLEREHWYLVLRFGQGSLVEPFAGVVTSRRRATRAQPESASLLAPGSLGSPVFGVDGALVGIVSHEGDRRTRAIPTTSFVGFLKGSVRAEDAR